jgi:protein involved in polysaccharide export with SLBB domain
MNKYRIMLIVLWVFVQTGQAAIIKVGSVLDIRVSGHDEFSGRYVVGENGTIDYPLLADQNIVDISTAELMNDLTFLLAKHIDNPLVLVEVVTRPEVLVTVLGQVVRPGPVTTYKGASAQEAIQLAGGPTPLADLERIKVVHGKRGERNAEFFDLKHFMREGSMESMPRLGQDDVVIVLSTEHNRKVKVIGAVNKPGFYSMETEMNLFEMIYLAGGPSEKADLSRVRRFSKRDGTSIEEVVDVQEYIDEGRMDDVPKAAEGDVIIVYAKWFDWATFLTILNNVLLMIVTVQGIRGAIDK